MPTLYHSPDSRSSRVIAQMMHMGKLDDVDVVVVDVVKGDCSGAADPRNPHPEGKVPFLVTDDGEELRESAAIMMYLDEYFGQPLSPAAGTPGRASFLSWMAYSGGVLEPVLVAALTGLEHEALGRNFRGMEEVGAALARGLSGRDFLLGDELSVADILLASPFQWMPDATPDIPDVKAWVARVGGTTKCEGLPDYEAAARRILNAAPQAQGHFTGRG